MTEQEARNLFMDYLYDEMDNKQKQIFEAFLKNYPELKKELNELAETRNILQFMPLDEPDQKLVMMAPEPDLGEKINQPEYKTALLNLHPAIKTVFAVAASVLIILFGASLSGLNMGQTEDGFYLAFGENAAQAEEGIGEEQVLMLTEQIREENVLLMTVMLEQARADQHEQLQEALNLLTDYYESRRQQDLMLIAEGLMQLEESTYHRFRQTDETLGDIIYALSYPTNIDE